MNYQKEITLRNKAEEGSLKARKQLIEGLMHQVKYIAKDYTNKGLEWDDLIQEGRMGLIKSVDAVLEKPHYQGRIWNYAKKKVRDTIRNAFYNLADTIRKPRSAVRRERLLQSIHALNNAIVSYDNSEEDFTVDRLDGIYVAQDNWNRLTLHDKLIEILDSYLTFQEQDVIKLTYGFGHDYFDNPDWQKPNKALSLRKVGELLEISATHVGRILSSALDKLQCEEIQYQLLPWRRS